MKSPLEVIRAYPPHDYSLHGVFMSRLEREIHALSIKAYTPDEI